MPVQLEGEVRAPPLDQLGTDPRLKLSGRPFGVRDDERQVDVEAVLHHRPHESLDEHGRLAGPGARRHEHCPVRVDRCELLVVGWPSRTVLPHIRQRSHQVRAFAPLQVVANVAPADALDEPDSRLPRAVDRLVELSRRPRGVAG